MQRLRPGLLLLAACAGPSGPTELSPPEVPVLLRWPDGTRFTCATAPGLPDEPAWRAAAIWWREALRQTTAFGLAGAHEVALPRLVLAIDPDRQTLTGSLVDVTGERILAGGEFRSIDLPAAIDRIAWACRIAVGERCAAPLPVAATTSAEPDVVLAVADAEDLLEQGAFQSAHRTLQIARRRDGAAPFVLDGVVAGELLRGELEKAERTAREALGYELRLAPTTQHRLARNLLLVRASRAPAEAATYDRELLRLAEAMRRERPHDEEGLLTLALAHNFRADFAVARPLFEELLRRLPNRSVVPYHLGWSCLATGDPAAAVRHLRIAAARMPLTWVLLPLALALYEAGDHEALTELLADAAADSRDTQGVFGHQVRRMQAAHALLCGDRAAAREILLDDLRWLVRHPLALERATGEFAEQGELLVRLGGSDELPSLLAALQQQRHGRAVADACAFVGGLAQVAATGQRLVSLEDSLARGGDNVWSARLMAFAHEQRGEVGDLLVALTRAARLSESPMTKALLARSLVATGRLAEGRQLRDTLRAELRVIHLRRTCLHPLFGPELAFAAIVE